MYKKLLLIVLFLFLFVFPRLYYSSRPLDRDEGEYAYSAWIMGRGIMPYENSFLQKPPMIIYTYYFGQLFDDVGTVPPRILLLLAVLISSVFLAKFAKNEWGENAFWLALFVANAILVLPIFVPYSANCEYFMLVPYSAILFLYSKYKSDATSKIFFWTGVLYSLAILYKPLPMFVVGFILSVWLYEIWKFDRSIRRMVFSITSLALGFSATTIIVLLPFMLTGSLKYLIESAYFYNLLYINYHGFSLANFAVFMYVFFLVLWILYFIVFYYAIKRPTRWWFYLGGLITSLVSVYQSKFAHYYLLAVPFLTLITVQSVILLSKSKLAKNIFGKSAFLIVSIFCVISIFSFTVLYFISLPYESYWKSFGDKPLFNESIEVAKAVDAISDPSDYIYIVGTEPQIYFYTKRQSASRFVINTVLEMDTPMQLVYQKQVIADISKHPPKVIIYSGKTEDDLDQLKIPKDYYYYVKNLLANNYDFVGGYFENNSGQFVWSNDLGYRKLGEGSMAVYIRKK